ncbi:MAG TPA: glutamine--tRNA ligase [Clostridiales bacterium]|nr:glutamine--tRNA ligase [Clostridiales bacterium]
MTEYAAPTNFIEEAIDESLKNGVHKKIVTRFPPEPNGYLHIGHAKAICINFGLKQKYGGVCNLRFDDTNPSKEDVEYVNSIQEDIKWLGFTWDNVFFASDYFDKMYECAVLLIKKGLAYVCDLSADEIRETRGTLTEPGTESPYRNRSIEENLRLFEGMKNGEFEEGSRVLRAKIDMASNNINMRDPVIYRIVKARHHRQGDKWVVYPMYDFAHPIEDAIEGITHSCCSLEFEDHRPLYDWVTLNCEFPEPRPRQMEFSRLNINHTIMSKRYLKKLVDTGVVTGWNDPRMSTLSGMRERGYPAEAIRDFCGRIGVSKSNSQVDITLLEHCVRENLNLNATRVMVVTDPLKLVVENYPADKTEVIEIENNPNKPEEGVHTTTFGRELYIEREDFSLNPPPKYHRLKPDGMVRLKGAYILKYNRADVNENGEVTCVYCDMIEDSKQGGVNAGIKVKGVIHWVNANDSVDVTLNMYDYLLLDGEGDFDTRINPDSLKVNTAAKAEKFVAEAAPYTRFQFMRKGYFVSVADFGKDNLKFNSVVGLKDSYNK